MLQNEMKHATVHCIEDGPRDANTVIATTRARSIFTVQRKLVAVWVFVGVIPFILQIRSYAKFATPHKISQRLVIPQGLAKEVANLTQYCPAEGMLLSGSWFNIQATHYYVVKHGRVCHFVLPQYNAHGNYLMGATKVKPSPTTPASCTNDSYVMEQYFYHGSIGYYSFYEEQAGTYCARDNTSYIRGEGLGSVDINGAALADDTGVDGYRFSYWLTIGGGIWLAFRALVLHRCYITVKRYGRACHESGEMLNRKEAVVFVQENLRLVAHGATNSHRILVLYLLIEGFMSDVFLLVASDGLSAKLQYASMGYNLSALVLLVFEIFEKMNCLSEKWRMFFKRLLFSYETAFLGEIVSAAVQQELLTLLNQTRLKESRPTALAVSYYLWSLVGHGIFVLNVIGFLIGVRILSAVVYVSWKHGSLRIFLAPCSIDTTLKLRNKMTLLGGYRWKNHKLLYTKSALKSFGLQHTTETDGKEFLVIRKLCWFAAPANHFLVIGAIARGGVLQCAERPCSTGSVIQFFNQDLWGVPRGNGSFHAVPIQVQLKVASPR